VDGVVAFFAAPFPPDQRECAECMHRVAEHMAATGVAAGLDAVPFNSIGYGLFPPGRGSDPSSPYIGVWFDDPHPMYWVQIRARQGVDGEMVACEQCLSVEEAGQVASAFVPRLLALAASGGEA
jgi:hypothetical protein